MSGRIGGKSRRPINHVGDISKLHVHVLPDMATALKLSKRPFWAGHSEKDNIIEELVGQRPVTGEAARLKLAQEQSDQLVEDALAVDPRLARKAQWLRRDEGEHVCAAALAEGDDQPFYKRQRTVVNEATMAGEPLRIVISTDDNNVPPGTAAAFIAVTRLVQQFCPIEVWWQGAWLTDDDSKGFVFTVPLVKGDMDYSRLEFCIADAQRDIFSYQVMATHAVLDLKESWSECGHRAKFAYHPKKDYRGDGEIDFRDSTKFVSHHGVMPTGESVANLAADWLGWRSHYSEQMKIESNSSSAGQTIPCVYVSGEITDADRRRWEKQDQQERAKSRKEAADRMQI